MSTKPLQVNEVSAAYQAQASADDVPPGYKKTEVGVIPEDWEAVSLGNVFTFKNGLNKAKKFFGHGTPIVNYMDVYRQPGLVTGDLMGRVSLSPQEIKNFDVRKGDVFFTRTSETVEEVGIASVMLDEPIDTVFSGFVLRARPKNDILEDQYKKYCFTPPAVRRQITSRSSYTTRALTNGRLLSVVSIAVPGKTEQRAIAEALSDVDGLLAALDKLIAKKRAIKQAAMQQLLTGKTRLPGFSGPWETKRLGELGRIRGGSGFPTSHQGEAEGDYPFFKVSDMKNEGNETFMQIANNYISEAVRKRLGAIAFSAKSIVFAKIGAAIFLERKKILAKASCIDNNMAAFTIDDGFADYRFVHYVLLNTKLGDLVSTTALPSLSSSVLSSVEIRLPAIPEQTAIATVLSDMDAEIAALEARRDKVKQIKQGMMQQLLTGRVRLIKAEGAA
ncbi:MAG: restriction endonuclease subunit S [Nitrospira sp.]|nr:restriction endonuclease subunit S [Nitrospira sp.]